MSHNIDNFYRLQIPQNMSVKRAAVVLLIWEQTVHMSGDAVLKGFVNIDTFPLATSGWEAIEGWYFIQKPPAYWPEHVKSILESQKLEVPVVDPLSMEKESNIGQLLLTMSPVDGQSFALSQSRSPGNLDLASDLEKSDKHFEDKKMAIFQEYLNETREEEQKIEPEDASFASSTMSDVSQSLIELETQMKRTLCLYDKTNDISANHAVQDKNKNDVENEPSLSEKSLETHEGYTNHFEIDKQDNDKGAYNNSVSMANDRNAWESRFAQICSFDTKTIVAETQTDNLHETATSKLTTYNIKESTKMQDDNEIAHKNVIMRTPTKRMDLSELRRCAKILSPDLKDKL